MGWAAREVSSDEVKGLRCFLCCDINVFVPCKFAADVDNNSDGTIYRIVSNIVILEDYPIIVLPSVL